MTQSLPHWRLSLQKLTWLVTQLALEHSTRNEQTSRESLLPTQKSQVLFLVPSCTRFALKMPLLLQIFLRCQISLLTPNLGWLFQICVGESVGHLVGNVSQLVVKTISILGSGLFESLFWSYSLHIPRCEKHGKDDSEPERSCGNLGLCPIGRYW